MKRIKRKGIEWKGIKRKRIKRKRIQIKRNKEEITLKGILKGYKGILKG